MIGVVIMAVCMSCMAATFWWSFRQRGQMTRMLDGPLLRGAINDATPGSAAQIEDGGVVPSAVLLGAMSWRHQQDEDFELPDEGVGNLLGLVYHRWRDLGPNNFDPIVYDGTRAGRQVWLRLGRDNSTIRGVGFNARRMRTCVAVRAALPEFELGVSEGRLVIVSGGGPKLEELLARMAPSPDAWGDVRVVGGPDGLVASHGVLGGVPNGWVYDLWLLERIADQFGATPLEPVELGREWEPPYDLARWAPSLRDELSAV